MRPRLLDLFCGAGGASKGYYRAGFDVVGVDISPQKHYPFTFHQADALTFPLEGFDVIHASPPCQGYSGAFKAIMPRKEEWPRLIAPMYDRLVQSGKPWILENVQGAAKDMINPVMLCGTMFGLRVQRHRLFDSSHLLFSAGRCHHQAYDVSVRCYCSEYLGVYLDKVTAKGQKVRRAPSCRLGEAKSAMGVDWAMTQRELGESIPPAYTQWLGQQILDALPIVQGVNYGAA